MASISFFKATFIEENMGFYFSSWRRSGSAVVGVFISCSFDLSILYFSFLSISSFLFNVSKFYSCHFFVSDFVILSVLIGIGFNYWQWLPNDYVTMFLRNVSRFQAVFCNFLCFTLWKDAFIFAQSLLNETGDFFQVLCFFRTIQVYDNNNNCIGIGIHVVTCFHISWDTKFLWV